MVFKLDPELRLYLEYLHDTYRQANTNKAVENLGSRGKILADATKDLSKILDGKDMEKFPGTTWIER